MNSASQTLDDVEKGAEAHIDDETKGEESRNDHSPDTILEKLASRSRKAEATLIKYNFEARGVQRVLPHECDRLLWKSYTQAFNLWFSVNLAAVNITLGMLAPIVYALSFRDASLCAAFGSLLGSTAVAYVATWGPISGNRTLIFTRYTFGWWPSKLIVILNLIILLGYSLLDVVVAGQILSAVSPNYSLSLVVGIIILAIITWLITTFGISVFHTYQRYAFIPQIIAFSIFYGVAARTFDISTPSDGDTATVAGNRLSFFSLCFSAAITYSGTAADLFVYYPPTTSRPFLFLASLLGLAFSFTYALVLGVGLGSGVKSVPSYSKAYEDHGQGALLVEGLSLPLHAFGRLLAVVIALGLISNLILPAYSSGIDFQILGRSFQRVPRVVWNTAGIIIFTVCALAGRDHLGEIFTNFLALMGYWVAIWIAITIEEQVIFRRRKGYDWSVWNEQEKLPLGIAALVAFLIGWAGAILCMAQVWYIGPIAKRVGENGADVSFALLGRSLLLFCIALQYPCVLAQSSIADTLHTIDGQLRRFRLGGISVPSATILGAQALRPMKGAHKKTIYEHLLPTGGDSRFATFRTIE